MDCRGTKVEAGKSDRKIIQVREYDVTDDKLIVKVVCSGPILDIFFNRLKRICWWSGFGGYKKDRSQRWFQGLGSAKSEDRALITWDAKIMGRLRLRRRSAVQFWILNFSCLLESKWILIQKSWVHGSQRVWSILKSVVYMRSDN